MTKVLTKKELTELIDKLEELLEKEDEFIEELTEGDYGLSDETWDLWCSVREAVTGFDTRQTEYDF